MYNMMNTVEVKAALKAKDAEIRSLVRGGKELQKTIDKLRDCGEARQAKSTAS
jgi:hypothetical protein